MPDEREYEAALSTALAVIHLLETEPWLGRQQRLAKVTFAILAAIRGDDGGEWGDGSGLPPPAVCGQEAVICRGAVSLPSKALPLR